MRIPALFSNLVPPECGRKGALMRIAVLGSGRQGLACAIDLLRENDLTELLLLDADQQLLDRALSVLDDPRVRSARVDATDESAIVPLLTGCAVVVSAVPYFLNLGVTRAAIRAGCSMTDMGGNTDVVFQQRSLDGDARQAGVSIVPDQGLAPGLGNILAMHSIDGMDEVDDLRIRCGGIPLEPHPPLGYALFFSIHGLLNEYSGESVCLRDGKVARRPTLSEQEWIEFPEPVGLCRAAHTSGGISTLPWTLEGRVRRLDYKTVRYPGHWPRIAFLKEIGLLETKPVRVGRTSLPPRDVLASLLHPILDRPNTRDVIVLRVRARGTRSGESVTRQFDLLEAGDEPPGLTAMMKLTAFPTAAVALSLGRGALRGPGVLTAETSVDAEAMIGHLRSRRIRVAVTETVRRG
jgi:lysine 6-dehydrogenase